MSVLHYPLKKVRKDRRNSIVFFKTTFVLYDFCGDFQDFVIWGRICRLNIGTPQINPKQNQKHYLKSIVSNAQSNFIFLKE